MAATTSPGTAPSAGTGAAGAFAAGEGAAGAAGAALGAGAAAGAGSAALPEARSKKRPSSMMMRHSATSMAKTSTMLTITTVPSKGSRARNVGLGMTGILLFVRNLRDAAAQGIFNSIITHCVFFE